MGPREQHPDMLEVKQGLSASGPERQVAVAPGANSIRGQTTPVRERGRGQLAKAREALGDARVALETAPKRDLGPGVVTRHPG